MKYEYFLTTIIEPECSKFRPIFTLDDLKKKSEANIIYFDDVDNRFQLRVLLGKIEPCSSLYVLSLHDLGCTPREIIQILKRVFEYHISLFILGDQVDIYATIDELEEKYSDNLDQHIDDEDYLMM